MTAEEGKCPWCDGGLEDGKIGPVTRHGHWPTPHKRCTGCGALVRPGEPGNPEPSEIQKAMIIRELVLEREVPSGWAGQKANCPHCGTEVSQTHPMQTLQRQMHNHLRTHGLTHDQARRVNPVSLHGIKNIEKAPNPNWQAAQSKITGMWNQAQSQMKPTQPSTQQTQPPMAASAGLAKGDGGLPSRMLEGEIAHEKHQIDEKHPSGVYWSGRQGKDPGARLRSLVQARAEKDDPKHDEYLINRAAGLKELASPIKKARDPARDGQCPKCQSYEPCEHDKPWPKEKAGHVKQGDVGTAKWWQTEKMLVIRDLLTKAHYDFKKPKDPDEPDWDEVYKPDSDSDDVAPYQQVHCEGCGQQYAEGRQVKPGHSVRVKSGVCSRSCGERAYM